MKVSFSNLCVLIVEDHQFQRMVAEQTVKTLGVGQFFSAADGYQALDILEKESSVDVVICDLDLPGMDGIQFLGQIANRQLAKAVILASAMEPQLIRTVEDLATEHGIRVLGAVSKPLSLDRLRELMALYFGDEDGYTPQKAARKVSYSEKELKVAIAENQFTLYHQPKVLLRSGRMVATEALCRWLHPDVGIVSPFHFISLMETSGLISDLTLKLCDHAIETLEAFHHAGRAVAIGINLSAVVLADTTLPDILFQKMRSKGLPPELLTLEITESTLIQHTAKALETLARLKMKGFSLSIDDFGTGYSSMQQLNRIPFSELKIDQSFVRGAEKDRTRKAIIEANIQLAHTLGMETVAEGVETLAQWQLLDELNCDLVQGYFIAKPMPVKQLNSWEKAWLSRQPIIPPNPHHH